MISSLAEWLIQTLSHVGIRVAKGSWGEEYLRFCLADCIKRAVSEKVLTQSEAEFFEHLGPCFAASPKVYVRTVGSAATELRAALSAQMEQLQIRDRPAFGGVDVTKVTERLYDACIRSMAHVGVGGLSWLAQEMFKQDGVAPNLTFMFRDGYIPDGSGVSNVIIGDVSGTAVQAGRIYGGVNFHSPPPSATQRRSPIVTVMTGAQAWAHAKEFEGTGIPISGHCWINILIEAFDNRAIILHELRPIVLHRSQPTESSAFYNHALLPLRPFTVLLDSNPPHVTAATDDSYQPKADFPFVVTASDPEILSLGPRSQYLTQWELELRWTSAGNMDTTVINDDGRPFLLHPDT